MNSTQSKTKEKKQKEQRTEDRKIARTLIES